MPQTGQQAESPATRLMTVARQNPLVLMLLLGTIGGFAGWVISELIQESGQDYDAGKYGTFFSSNIYLSTGAWFGLAMMGIGAAMSLAQGLLERNVEKSKIAALRTIPASLVGGFIAGVIAQKVYESLLSVEFNVIPRAIGWGIAGCLAGAGIGAGYMSLVRVRNSLLGGLIGGVAGGVLFNVVGSFLTDVMSRMVGITVIGSMIGLSIALVNQVTTTAYLEMAMPEGPPVRFPLIGRTHVIGCANSVSIAVTRDPMIREQHVKIDVNGSSATFTCFAGAPPVLVNGNQTTTGTLNNGDVLIVGNTSLRLVSAKGSRLAGTMPIQTAPIQPGPTMNQGQQPHQPAARPTLPVNPTGQGGVGSAPSQPTAPQQPASRPTIQMKPPQQ